MKLWAILHKPSGNFLPYLSTGRGGYTWTEPTPPNEIPPRLFTTKRAAKCALTYWLVGPISRSFVDDDEDWSYMSVSHRKEEEMEVVPITLQMEPPQ